MIINNILINIQCAKDIFAADAFYILSFLKKRKVHRTKTDINFRDGLVAVANLLALNLT